MELQYFGGNCVRIITKKASVVIDDNLAELGSKPITKDEDIVLNTNADTIKTKTGGRIVVSQPGEYEVSNISIQGVAARAHMDSEGTKATMYKLQADDIRLVVTGHIYPDLTDDELEAIGTVDVLIIPVGGNGYTLDPIGALKVIKKMDPKIIIPTHYADSKLKYEVPQQELAAALKDMGMEPHETVPKLKLKGTEIPEAAQVIILERAN
jgi:L-ascorbate metabolism protein UlaG (beta-lactamase superfamily)